MKFTRWTSIYINTQSFTRTIPVVLLSVLQRHQFRGICWCSICTVWWRCTSNKAETCQNRRWKWKWLKYLRINLIFTLYCYRWVDTSAGELLVPEGIIRPVVSVTITGSIPLLVNYWFPKVLSAQQSVLLSLGRYLCWWTINSRGYHSPSS